MVAASFGVSQFDVSTIVHAVSVLEEHDQSGSNDDANGDDDCFVNDDDDPYVVSQRINDMRMELNGAVGEGFVEETAPGHYRFAHDRIRESAYSLLPSGESRSKIHLKVGRQLRAFRDTSNELGLFRGRGGGFSKESLLLHAAKQSNLGANLIQDEWELLELAELNFQAAELAARKAAFYSSMEYLQVGLSHLGTTTEKAWERHYDLALKFSIALARMQYSCGLFEEAWATSEAVIQHGKNFSDKARMYHTRLLCLTHQERHDEALDLALQIFEMLDRPWPRRYVMIHALREFMKIRRFLDKTSDEEILSLPIKDDQDLQNYVEFLEKVSEIAWLGGKKGYLLLYATRAVGLIAERQNYARSFTSISVWASIKTNFGDFNGGYRYSELAKAMGEMQRQSLPHFVARVDMARCNFINLWHKGVSFRTDLASAEEAFRQFWKHGLVDVALMDVSGLLQHLFVAGEPLERIANECDKYSEAFVDFQQTMHWYINAPIYQAVLNLQGCNETGEDDNNPLILLGSHITESEASFLENCQKMGNKAATFQFQFWSLFLAYHFGDLGRAKGFLKSMRRDLFEDGPGVLVTNRLLYTGLVYFALYRETGKVRYRRRAIQAQRQLERWWKKGVDCCVYMCQLLWAENQSCNPRAKIDTVAMAYDQAIQSVAEVGLCHHHALAQELAGSFLYQKAQSSKHGQDHGSSILLEAKQYLAFAVQLYKDWGCRAKVDDLRAKYNSLGLDEESSSGTIQVDLLKPLKRLCDPVGSSNRTRSQSELETLDGSHFLGDSRSLRCDLLSSSTTSRQSRLLN